MKEIRCFSVTSLNSLPISQPVGPGKRKIFGWSTYGTNSSFFGFGFRRKEKTRESMNETQTEPPIVTMVKPPSTGQSCSEWTDCLNKLGNGRDVDCLLQVFIT